MSRARRLTKDTLLSRFKNKHGEYYDYSLVDYSSTMEKIKIICPKHGEFRQVVYNHLRGKGCPGCGRDKISKSKIKSLTSFLNDAVRVHGKKYKYNISSYVDMRTPVEIICSVHGSFFQDPGNHIHCKSGCPKCSNLLRPATYTIKACKKLGINLNKQVTLYFLEFYSTHDKEKFIKIGITKRPIKQRFQCCKDYNIKPISIEKYDLKTCIMKEKYIKENFVKYHHTPKYSIGGGYTECFKSTTRIKNLILKCLKENYFAIL